MTTPRAATLTSLVNAARPLYTSRERAVEGVLRWLNLTKAAGYALTPLAPEVPPRRDGLREALASWVEENPWERVGPADGESAVWDDPWRCYACGSDMPFTGDNRPPFDERRPGPEDGEHDPECPWLVSRRILAATRTPEPPDSGPDTETPQERDVQALHDSILPGPHVRGNCRFCDERGVSIERAESPDSGDGAAGLTEAWAEVVPVLPGGWGVQIIPGQPEAWEASTVRDVPNRRYPRSGRGGSPASAVRDLAARLRSGSPAPEGGE